MDVVAGMSSTRTLLTGGLCMALLYSEDGMYLEDVLLVLPELPGELRASRRCARSSLERIWSIMARSAVSGASPVAAPAELRRDAGCLLLGGGYMGSNSASTS